MATADSDGAGAGAGAVAVITADETTAGLEIAAEAVADAYVAGGGLAGRGSFKVFALVVFEAVFGRIIRIESYVAFYFFSLTFIQQKQLYLWGPSTSASKLPAARVRSLLVS